MKKIFVALIITVGIALYFFYPPILGKFDNKALLPVFVSPTPQIRNSLKSPSPEAALFVPYWSDVANSIDTENYTTAIYFGIAPSKDGIVTSDSGYGSLPDFVANSTSFDKKLLTLRMVNGEDDFAILKDKNIQKKVIAQTISLAKENNFSGIVLDLELSALPFDSLIQQINDFVKDFAYKAHNSDLEFSMTMYGDTFYRLRPFDVKTLGNYVDRMYIMSYDFHKSRGNPGPNFPFSEREKYGYDFPTMIDNFSTLVPKEKLVVTFGMFGYDWTTDDKGVATSNGTALSLYKIRQQFLVNCTFTDCRITRDEKTKETKVTYKDSENKNHVVWFEDEESVQIKGDYLEDKGIFSRAFWAYGYF